ncbi:MAG: manganese efflux pump MntP family protein [Candidatus Omnitrophota bacterium]
MSILTIFLIALALSMDAFAVSIASGIITRKQKVYHAFRFGLCFGGFQMLMPVLGWISGRMFYHLIAQVDHWLAFTLLFLVGSKMIYEAVKLEKLESVSKEISSAVLAVLGLATSIDALVVGLSLSFLNVSILAPVVIIGAVTFAMSFAGFMIGNKFGHIFEKKVEVLAGTILILIGFKILLEHLNIF